MTDAAWYYTRAGERQGPVSDAQLRDMVRGGAIQPGDYVWREGMADWALAGQVPELLDEWRPQTPPPPHGAGGGGPYGGEPLVLEPEPVAAPAGYAGFWKRLVALILDQLILMAAVFLLVFLFVFVILLFTGREDVLDDERFEPVMNLVGLVLTWLYYALMESSSHQATLGKLALGIMVTDTDGRRIGFGRATGRHFAKIISWLILGIGFLIAAFTPRKQALHDMIAHCLVVNRR